jgi:hypothetical protein
MDTLKQYPTTAVVAVSKQQQPSAEACDQQRQERADTGN